MHMCLLLVHYAHGLLKCFDALSFRTTVLYWQQQVHTCVWQVEEAASCDAWPLQTAVLQVAWSML